MTFLTNKNTQAHEGLTRINIRTLVNTAAVRTETRNGREIMIVPSATLPDDVVMNGVFYPADEIEKGYKTLDRTPAPLGHPLVNDRFISAKDPEGLNLGYIGAWNENVRRENGRVFLDKIIDIEVANRSEGGKSVIDAINKGEPVHTSNALLANLVKAEKGLSNKDGIEYGFIATEMQFDHDAILLNEEGAATPEQGVGLMVNAKGENINVINSALDDADREMDWAVQHLARAVEQRKKAGKLDALKSKILDIFSVSEETNPATKENADMADEKKLDALTETVNALADSVKKMSDGLAETISNSVEEKMKPVLDAQKELEANQKAKDDAELTELQNKIVEGGLMDEDAAKELTLNTARALAKKAEPGKAAGLNNAFKSKDGKDEFEGYDLNANMKEEA
ncbi:hypothetical protein [Litorimonas haliclonae]|uniref:hypothetical protein n=1 Tax=Litorimonas haliclonae TaxID=2081977 RepID=UPI0039F14DD6